MEILEGFACNGYRVVNLAGAFHADDGAFITPRQQGVVVDDIDEDMVTVRFEIDYFDTITNREAVRLVDVEMTRDTVGIIASEA